MELTFVVEFALFPEPEALWTAKTKTVKNSLSNNVDKFFKDEAIAQNHVNTIRDAVEARAVGVEMRVKLPVLGCVTVGPVAWPCGFVALQIDITLLCNCSQHHPDLHLVTMM